MAVVILILSCSLVPTLCKNIKSDSTSVYEDSYDEPNSYANPYDTAYSNPSVDSGKSNIE